MVRKFAYGVSAVIAIGIAILFAVPATATAQPQFDHPLYGCTESGTVASQVLWTPALLVASPYKGSATGSTGQSSFGSFTFAFAQFTSITSTTSEAQTSQLSVSNGEYAGLFYPDTWTEYSLKTFEYFGTGQSNPCTASYLDEITSQSTYGQGKDLLPSGSTSDVNVPGSFSMLDTQNGQTYSSVQLTGLSYTANDGGYGSCNIQGQYTYSVSASTWASGGITIPIGTDLQSSFAITQGSSTNTVYTYTFPGDTGTWSWTTLSGQSSPGLSFTFAPC